MRHRRKKISQKRNLLAERGKKVNLGLLLLACIVSRSWSKDVKGIL